eukprot:UN13951
MLSEMFTRKLLHFDKIQITVIISKFEKIQNDFSNYRNHFERKASQT